MKKSGTGILLAVMLVFLMFTVGFFLGRNSGGAQVSVSVTGSSASLLDDAIGGAVMLPTDGPGSDAADDTAADDTASGQVNINSATLADLMELPGIGETYARRILEYRQANGPFQTVYDLILVEGIGEKRLEQILPYITIGG